MSQPSMQFAAASSTAQSSEQILQDLVEPVKTQLNGTPVDLLLAFFSPHYARHAARVAARLRAALAPRVLLGCTAEGVIAQSHEWEDRPAAALVAASLPGVSLTPFTLQRPDWQDVADGLQSLPPLLGDPKDPRLFLVLADPFSTPVEAALGALNAAFPGIPVAGGLVSGSARPGGNVLLIDGHALAAGTVGVALAGAVQIETLISQGCRPIGRPFRVTESQAHVIATLDGGSALEQMENLVAALPTEDQNLLEQGLFVGRAVQSGKGGLGRGDFYVRGVLGADRENGSILVGGEIPEGEIIQFHVRDVTTAAEDLALVLAPQVLFDSPCGGLLFACTARGSRLYGHADGDITIIRRVLGNLPLAGLFCAGEIAPLAGRNLLHSQTACMVLFRPAAPVA